MAWMLPTIIKNLFSRPATRRYPYKDIREPFLGYRGRIHLDPRKCDLSRDCARVCPSGAIEVSPEDRQWTYHPFRCVYCGACMQICPQRAITQDKFYAKPATTKEIETINVPL